MHYSSFSDTSQYDMKHSILLTLGSSLLNAVIAEFELKWVMLQNIDCVTFAPNNSGTPS